MGLIVALVTINCQMWFSQAQCVKDHMQCITYMQAIKPIDDIRVLTKDQQLAKSYTFCIEHKGQLE